MNDPIWSKAEQLAKRPYALEISIETLTNGQHIFFVENPEFEGCMAQGATEQEALANLLEARTEYIYSLIVDGLPVPPPAGSMSGTSTGGKATTNLHQTLTLSTKHDETHKALEEPQGKRRYIPRGDLV